MCDGTGEDPISDFKVGINFFADQKNCPGSKSMVKTQKNFLKA